MDISTSKLTVLDQIAFSDKVRRKIMDAATSIQEISEKAGVSLPVTHDYVKKKSEVMRMIMEDVLNIFGKASSDGSKALMTRKRS